MAKYIILYGVVVLVVSLIVIRIARGPKEPSQIPCDTCKYLVRKGGYYKYYCGNQQAQDLFSDRFDKPPEYCGFWESRRDIPYASAPIENPPGENRAE